MNLDTFIQSGTRPTSQRETSALLDSCRNQILLLTKSQTMNSPITNDPVTICGMSMEKAIAIAETAPKGQVLKTLTAAHMAETNPKRPIFARKPVAAITPPAAAPARPAPPASETPVSDKLLSLPTAERIAYLRQNQKAISAERSSQLVKNSSK